MSAAAPWFRGLASAIVCTLKSIDASNKPQARVVRCAMEYDAIIGVGAACLTTVSHWPQLKKCWQTGRAEDLSLRAFVILALGVTLWLVYGLMKSDWIIMAANGVSLVLLCGILFFKLRGARASQS
jgi:MtN3 and saliva related transmembrane protein